MLDPILAPLAASQRAQTRLAFQSRWVPRRKSSGYKAAMVATVLFVWLSLVHKYYYVTEPHTHTHLIGPAYESKEDQTHHVFLNTARGPTDRHPLSIRAYDSMSDSCAEKWVVHHQWGHECAGTDLSEGLKVDGVWAWVNGSDPTQIQTRRQYKPTEAMRMDAAHRFSEHNELLYSIRSALSSLGSESMQRLHILASAYPHPNGSINVMTGQVPNWLDKEEALTSKSRIVLHYDADYFSPIESLENSSSPSSELQDWRKAVIPSFNSLALESQIHNIDHVSSDQLVYYNDDFFTLRKLAVSDFTTPLYGPVIKSLTRFTSMYLPAENTIWRTINPAGEEPGIKRAAWVLGMRFSSRPYYYITHHPRTLWLPLLREAAQTFPDAFTNTPLSRFRAQDNVPASIQAVFLGSWYIVERHREALLWTWTVARWGGKSGTLSLTSKNQMWIELANEASPPKSHIGISVPIRAPIEDPNIFEKANISMPTSTEYSFSSKDGYALSYVDSMWFWNRRRHGYPDLTRGLLENNLRSSKSLNESRYLRDPSFVATQACTIVRSTCFGLSLEDESASDFFKRIAFRHPKCGDCIVTALIGASGQSGIDKFLPHADTDVVAGTYANSLSRPPHLPLTSDWMTTDFSMLHAIPKGSLQANMTLRSWCIRLIQRYSYVLGSAESDFYKVEKASKLEAKLQEVERRVQKDVEHTQMNSSRSMDTIRGYWRHNEGSLKRPFVFLCLNDDMEGTGKLRHRMDTLLASFFTRMWASKLSFETRD
ncbi:hypothetical protein KCU89_g1170, partial [Aureobasidium melanogenum]